jgi:hypothetical protein
MHQPRVASDEAIAAGQIGEHGKATRKLLAEVRKGAGSDPACAADGTAHTIFVRPLRIRSSNVVRDSRHKTLEKQGYCLAAIQCHEWKRKPHKGIAQSLWWRLVSHPVRFRDWLLIKSAAEKRDLRRGIFENHFGGANWG